MRSFIVLLLAATVALAAGAFVPHTHEVKYADKDFLKKQEDLLVLLRHVYQPDWNQQLVSYAKQYKIDEHYDHYTHPEVVKEFYHLFETHGFLPKGEIFSIYNEEHREEATGLFYVLYYAKDWDTFYKTATWARYYMNEGQFVYALTVAVTHRKDMEGFVLPAPYEIYPYFFVNSKVVRQAHQYKMQGYYGMKKVDNHYTTTIPFNYTIWYARTNPEQKIAYFTEDIGLNTFYYYFNIDYPFWLGGEEFGLKKDRRGEFYLFEHQQLLARYYLERLSNGLGHIPEFSWKTPIKTGYYPFMTYFNGYTFPSRDNYYNFYTEEYYYDIAMVEEYERRIIDAIDAGFYHTPTGEIVDFTHPEAVDMLGNLIQSNPDSYNTKFYKYLALFARIIMGNSVDTAEQHYEVPSVLEHFETALRDPVFYQIYKRIVHYYFRFKDHLPTYKTKDLIFEGVKITKTEIDKLITYFDKFDFDITNVIDIEPEPYVEGKYPGFTDVEYKEDPVIVKARQSRLNHIPFSYKLSVTAEKPVKGVVRVFMGPKYDEYGNIYHLNENRENFVELDYFVHDFVSGTNYITRESIDFDGYVKDRTTFYELYKKVMLAYKGETKFPLDQTEAHCGFPHRLMLPKGKKGGMPFQFFFIVSPYHAPTVETFKGYDETISCGVGSGARYYDSLPMGYPFDRKVDETTFYKLPNVHFEDVFVFHKKEADINKV